MKIMDKVIKTGLEQSREGVIATSMIAKIEERVRKMVLERFGYILTKGEINQITRRETERDDRREESLIRSQWNILRSKERATLMGKLRRDIQEGKLFKKHERNEGMTVGGGAFGGKTLPGERRVIGISETGNRSGKDVLQGRNGGLHPLNGGPSFPKPKEPGFNLKQTFINY